MHVFTRVLIRRLFAPSCMSKRLSRLPHVTTTVTMYVIFGGLVLHCVPSCLVLSSPTVTLIYVHGSADAPLANLFPCHSSLSTIL